MRNLVNVFLIIFLLFFCFSGAFCQVGLKFLIRQDEGILGQSKFIEENNLEVYEIFYQQFFLTEGKLDTLKLKKQIEIQIPNKSSTGFAVLDWEGEAIATFRNQTSDEKVDSYIGQFICGLKLAKKLRPKIKWGYYHILTLSYWGSIEEFRKQNKKLESIIEIQDFIAPSLYVYNPNLVKYQESNLNYLRNKLLQSLEMGVKYDKPVYPFIWHRTPIAANKGNALVQKKYFEEVVELISTTKYEGRKSEGIFWWHSETFSYRNRDKYEVTEKEYLGIVDYNLYQYSVFMDYFKVIEKFRKPR
ncbi:hypothetical protein [Echinicola sp. 20G]|uniref:hypothetical protein n=1 Tax=Echinicola sp. 20G TaxID=2781961 RepID=UPI00191091F6|nr:hypothetical protein [Echinicola sp. 20G]